MANKDYKNGKLVEIIREFNHTGATKYEINGINQAIAVPFWRIAEEKFNVIPKGSYKFINESGNNYLEITDNTILEQATQFQICYVYSQISSKYIEEFPELSVMVNKYNELVDDATKLFSYLKSVGMTSDTLQLTKVLSQLEPLTTWYMDNDGEIKTLPISDLYGKFQQMIDKLHKDIKDLLDIDYENFNQGLRDKTDLLLKELTDLNLKLEASIKNLTIEKNKELITTGNEKKQEIIDETNNQLDILAGVGLALKPKQVSDIEFLKRVNAKLNEVYEVLGYYKFNDGANHKRVISNEDDGSGVQLANGLWANIVHNGEVNVSWFGAKGDGVTDDTEAFNKALHCGAYYVTTDNKVFELTRIISLENINDLTIEFNGKIHFRSQDNLEHAFYFINCSNINIKNLSFFSENDKSYYQKLTGVTLQSSNIRVLLFENCHDVIIENYTAINAQNDLHIRGDVPSVANGEKEYKSYNFKIINWYSRGSLGNMFSDNTKNILIENADFQLGELKEFGGIAHNIYFAQNTLNAHIKNFKSRHITTRGGSVFHFTNGGKSELDNSYSPKNILIENADVVTTGNVLAGMLNVDVKLFNSKFVAEGERVTLAEVYNDAEFYFENCIVEKFPNCVLGTNVKDANTIFNCCQFKNVDKILWGVNENGHIKCVNSIIDSEYLLIQGTKENPNKTKSITISNNLITVKKQIQITSPCDFKLCNNIINSEDTVNDYIILNTRDNADGTIIYNNIFNTQQNIIQIFNFNPEIYPECNIKYGGNLLNGKFDKLEIIGQNSISKLNTLYMSEKMKQENVYDDYIAYMDEKTAYEKQQEKLEKDRQLAYEQALKENPELTYEEFMSVQPMTLNLVEEPQPSEALQKFMEKYL